jgi:hypothetical protein
MYHQIIATDLVLETNKTDGIAAVDSSVEIDNKWTPPLLTIPAQNMNLI